MPVGRPNGDAIDGGEILPNGCSSCQPSARRCLRATCLDSRRSAEPAAILRSSRLLDTALGRPQLDQPGGASRRDGTPVAAPPTRGSQRCAHLQLSAIALGGPPRRAGPPRFAHDRPTSAQRQGSRSRGRAPRPPMSRVRSAKRRARAPAGDRGWPPSSVPSSASTRLGVHSSRSPVAHAARQRATRARPGPPASSVTPSSAPPAPAFHALDRASGRSARVLAEAVDVEPGSRPMPPWLRRSGAR